MVVTKNYPIHFALRYGFFLIAVLCLLQYALSTEDLSARPQGQKDDPVADSDVDSRGARLCITLAPFAEIADIAAGVYDPTAPPSTATNTPLPPTATSMPVPPMPTSTIVAPTGDLFSGDGLIRYLYGGSDGLYPR